MTAGLPHTSVINVALKMLKMLRAFGQPVQHMLQHHVTML